MPVLYVYEIPYVFSPLGNIVGYVQSLPFYGMFYNGLIHFIVNVVLLLFADPVFMLFSFYGSGIARIVSLRCYCTRGSRFH